jgi:uncharacterized protein
MDSKLLEILACPNCKGPLTKGKGGNYFICSTENLAYPIVDGIPHLLASAAIAMNKIESAPMADPTPTDQ